ncbi:dynein light chain Tctex-type protein 2B isoform X1 [Eulemur rufifrons]|uniref:dynein light chain Tctex-type protein 2B isoform X1 n=1 Tax=Eulemur rufifrons TaxID=859984 RepID=UPI003742D478
MATSAGVSLFAGTSVSTGNEVPETEKNLGEPDNTYILRPVFQQRFRPSVVKECIHAVLKEELANAEYSPEEMPQLTKRLSENIKDKLKEMGFDRYKMVVQVVIGEQRGEGVFMAARCFWDADTDNYTHDVFMNFILCCSSIRLFLLLNFFEKLGKDLTMKKSELFYIVKCLNKIKISWQFGN